MNELTCPYCQSKGPFRYLEDIVCFREVAGTKDGTIMIHGLYQSGEGYDDGENPRLECRECLGEFAIPGDFETDFV